MKITNLKINGISNPLGYDFDVISASFIVSETKETEASFYKIQVSETKDFQKILYEITGEELNCASTILEFERRPHTRYYWRVFVRGKNGEEAISEPAYLETAKMQEAWDSRWIGTEKTEDFHPVFCKKVKIAKKVVYARLYICGLGLYEAYLNGNKIGDDYLTPGFYDYTEENQYQTYDLLSYLHNGTNEIKVVLGKGWYLGRFGLEGQSQLFGDRYALNAEIWLEYEDGSCEKIVTDQSWNYYGSDIVDSGIYDGEIYDHCLWVERENQVKQARILEMPEKPMVARTGLPLRVKGSVPVKEVIQTPTGEMVLDFGQNFAGYVEFDADFPKGTRITLDFGEILQNGCFYNENYRSAKAQFTYVSGGYPEKVWPHFTYYGFRYVRVNGWIGEVKAENFAGKVVYADLDRTGYFHSDHEMLNRLYENAWWGQCSNFIEVPTDCPQRDERLAWTGDTQVFARTASYNMDTRAFYHKFMRDLRFTQKRMNGGIPNYLPSLGNLTGACAVWGDVGTFLPEVLREQYGNVSDYAFEYEMMHDWVDYLREFCEDEQHLIRGQMQFGDWLALDGVTEQSMRGGTDDDYIASVYYCASAKKTAVMAEKLGKSDAAFFYRALSDKIYKAILEEYFAPSGRLAVDTQTAYIIALRFGIYRNKEMIVKGLLRRLKRDGYRMKSGFVGAPVYCQVLAENGLTDLAWYFLMQKDFPGWMHCIELGATTIWERWNSVNSDGSVSGTGMNSLNHYSYGAVVEFLYGYVAGIRPIADGFREALIQPAISGRLGEVQCRYDSVWGTWRSQWEIQDDGTIVVEIEVPFGCKAKVCLPEFEKEEMVLPTGVYTFTYMPKKDFRCIYNEESLLQELVKNPEVVEIMQKYIPVAVFMGNGDLEGRSTRLKDLYTMPYMGFMPEQVSSAIEVISKIVRKP